MNCKKGEVSHHLACDCREDAICKEVAGLRERLAASEKAREEAEKRAVEYVIAMNMAEEKLLAAESRAARLLTAMRDAANRADTLGYSGIAGFLRAEIAAEEGK